MTQNAPPKWTTQLQDHHPKLAEMYLSQSEQILKDGAIPAKYKILMTRIVDALTARPEGCFVLANRARAAGASEAEIKEAIEVAYLFGGAPALVTATSALSSES